MAQEKVEEVFIHLSWGCSSFISPLSYRNCEAVFRCIFYHAYPICIGANKNSGCLV